MLAAEPIPRREGKLVVVDNRVDIKKTSASSRPCRNGTGLNERKKRQELAFEGKRETKCY